MRRQHVLHVEEQRGREVVEHLHEDERGARDVARHRERQDDAAEEPEAGRAEVLRRLLHRAIDIGERCREVDEDEGKVVHGLDEDHAVEPFHEGNLDAEGVVEEKVYGAVAAEQELHCHGADEGRHDQRDEAERLDERRAAKDEARGKIGERQRESRGQHDRHCRNVERVPEGADEQVGSGEVGEIDERERTRALLGEGDVDHRRDRQDEEEQQEERDGGRGQGLAGRRGDSPRARRESADRHVPEPARVSARELLRFLGLGFRLRVAVAREGRPLLL